MKYFIAEYFILVDGNIYMPIDVTRVKVNFFFLDPLIIFLIFLILYIYHLEHNSDIYT